MKDLKKKPLLAYMTYPLTRPSPKENGKKAKAVALAIMAIFPTMTILLAHNSTQYLEQIETHRSILADIAIIKNADLVILGRPLDYSESSGSVWEYEIAKFFNKPIVTSDYLLGKSPEPLKWALSKNLTKLKVEKGSRFEDLCRK